MVLRLAEILADGIIYSSPPYYVRRLAGFHSVKSKK